MGGTKDGLFLQTFGSEIEQQDDALVSGKVWP